MVDDDSAEAAFRRDGCSEATIRLLREYSSRIHQHARGMNSAEKSAFFATVFGYCSSVLLARGEVQKGEKDALAKGVSVLASAASQLAAEARRLAEAQPTQKAATSWKC